MSPSTMQIQYSTTRKRYIWRQSDRLKETTSFLTRWVRSLTMTDPSCRFGKRLHRRSKSPEIKPNLPRQPQKSSSKDNTLLQDTNQKMKPPIADHRFSSSPIGTSATSEMKPTATLNERLYSAIQRAKAAVPDPRFSPLGASVDLVTDMKVSFSVHLYIDGYTRVDTQASSGPQSTMRTATMRYPYDRHSHHFLLALDLGLIPPREDLPDPSSCMYESGCLVAEIYDHRSKLAPISRRVLLRPDGMSVVNDINVAVGSTGADFNIALYIESDILRFTKRIDLRPFDQSRFHRYGFQSSTKLNIMRMPGFVKKVLRRTGPSLTALALMLTSGVQGNLTQSYPSLTSSLPKFFKSHWNPTRWSSETFGELLLASSFVRDRLIDVIFHCLISFPNVKEDGRDYERRSRERRQPQRHMAKGNLCLKNYSTGTWR